MKRYKVSFITPMISCEMIQIHPHEKGEKISSYHSTISMNISVFFTCNKEWQFMFYLFAFKELCELVKAKKAAAAAAQAKAKKT